MFLVHPRHIYLLLFEPTLQSQAIQDYISGDSDKYNNEQALVIYGPSGMGKSALMAKAIEQTEDDHKDKKVVYRFV